MTKNMLKAGSGAVAPLIAGAFRTAAVALVVLWPFALLLPINLKIALVVGVPYAALAESDIRVTPLHGAMAVSIIAMPGVRVDGDLGHSEVFLMDGGRMNGCGDASRYRNT